MEPLSYNQILIIIHKFYSKAIKDILIGYHFTRIKDFDEHIPRIASFWELQLTGSVTHKEHFPFRLMKVHHELQFTTGHMDRWIILFKETLEQSELEINQIQFWKDKLVFFKEKLLLVARVANI